MNDGISKEQQKVNKEWDEMAGEWDDMATKYRDEFLKLLWEQTRLNPQGCCSVVILDFGCGTGLLTEKMRQLSSSTSQYICIDASPAMIHVLQDKIKAGEWNNVQAYNLVLANYDTCTDERIKHDIDNLKGKVDLIVASSVMSFIPKDDLPATMQKLNELLKPNGGIFCHSDWPKSDEHPDGFTEEKANEMYEMGNLKEMSSLVTTIDMGGGYKGNVFVGVAAKE